MNKETTMKIAIVLITVIICIFAIEGTLRLLYPHHQTPFQTEGQIFTQNGVLGIKTIPNSTGTITYYSCGHEYNETITYNINSKGLRDIEHNYKPSNQTRILLLGDSFIFGAEVNLENTISTLLSQSLNNTEVINLGVSSYGTVQEYLYLKTEGLKYHPDIVITFIYTGNDGLDNIGISPSESSTKLISRPILQDNNITYKHYNSTTHEKNIRDKLRDVSYTYSILSEIYHKKVRLNLKFIGSEYTNQSTQYNEQINNTVQALVLIENLCETNSVQHFVYIIPTGSLVNNAYSEWEGTDSITYNQKFKTDLIHQLTQKNIIVIDLTPYLQNNSHTPGDIYFNYNGNPGHFTPNGNKLIANKIMEDLK